MRPSFLWCLGRKLLGNCIDSFLAIYYRRSQAMVPVLFVCMALCCSCGASLVFCPLCSFIVVFSGSCLALWSPSSGRWSWLLWFSSVCSITKTCLYNSDPHKPHFYIVKLGLTGVYFIFLNSAQSIDCGYSFEPPHRGGSNEYPQSMFWAEMWKISEFFIWKISVFGGEIFYIFE